MFVSSVMTIIMNMKDDHYEYVFNPIGAAIEIRNLSVCAMPVINCVQADANEPFAFLGAHCRFRAHDGGLLLVSRFFLTTFDRIESEPVLWDLPR